MFYHLLITRYTNIKWNFVFCNAWSRFLIHTKLRVNQLISKLHHMETAVCFSQSVSLCCTVAVIILNPEYHFVLKYVDFHIPIVQKR